MIAKVLIRFIAVVGVVTLAAHGAAFAEDPHQGMPHGGTWPGMAGSMAGAPSGMQAGTAAALQPMELTDVKVRGFFDAVDDLKTLGDEAGKWADTNPNRPEAFAQGMRFSNESLAILRKHGFKDHLEFQNVAYNAAMAYGVLQHGGKEAMKKKLNEAQAQHAQALEQMRQKLSPEQFKMMQQQMGAGMAMANTLSDVPDQNLELMKKYRERMEKLNED